RRKKRQQGLQPLLLGLEDELEHVHRRPAMDIIQCLAHPVACCIVLHGTKVTGSRRRDRPEGIASARRPALGEAIELCRNLRVPRMETCTMHRLPLLLPALLAARACLGQAGDDAPLPPPPVSNMQGGWDNRVANSQAAQWKDANEARPD